ncbi:hypothetical protein ACJJTC_006887 [Scirpophaga incertulas]
MSECSVDSLQLLPVERWIELEKLFEADWPRGIAGAIGLKTHKELNDLGLDYGFKVYCPYGDPSNGMVALNPKSKLNEIIIQCPKNDTNRLKEALIMTKIIDWKTVILVPYAPSNIGVCINDLAEHIDIEHEDSLSYEAHILNKTHLYAVESLPDGVTFQQLTDKDIPLVDVSWPNKYEGSQWLFEMLCKAQFGYGIFKENNLASWVFLGENGALTHLFTLAEHRRNGYAKILLKLVCNLYLQQCKNIFAYCLAGNDEASKLYKKLGFEKYHKVKWYWIKPKNTIK